MENFNKPHTPIKRWANDDKPREKMIGKGVNSLSTAELLAILINNGTRSKSAIDLARELLQANGNRLGNLAKLSLKDIQKIKGIGPAKAVTIKAALQLAVMLEQENFQDIPVIKTSRDIAQYLRKRLEHEPKEVFVALYLNKKNRVLASHIIASGGIDATIADVRIILKKALEEQATSIILSHNHPSGNLRPSQRDLELTKKIMEAARLIDIQVIDHIIVSDEGYYSFADDGILNK